MNDDAAATLPPLPDQARQRIVAFAAETLGELPESEVPAGLRRVARFTPSKRARLAAAALATAVDQDPVFRGSVGDRVRKALPELAAALTAGAAPPAADPDDVAALAYLLRPPRWQELVAAAVEQSGTVARSTVARQSADELSRRASELEDARATARTERERARAQLAAAAAELDEARRALRQASDAQRRAEVAREAAEADRDAIKAAAERAAAKASAEQRRLRARLVEVDSQLEQLRRTGRGARSTDDVRLWLLLDSVTNAAAGLRRELALPPPASRPADDVAAGLAQDAPPPATLALSRDDPAWLDALLAVPTMHLLVDGYNVTKTGFPDLPLESQRGRLVQGLAALAARTAAEITVVFDGAERTGSMAAPSVRGVRVLFSPVGRTADDVLVQLVRAEPAGRPLAVVSADREVVSRSERSGARGVPPKALLGLLGRA